MCHIGIRPWQIIPKDSPIILFFYSQIFSLLFSQTSPLFSQTSPLFLHYSQTSIQKLNCHDLCMTLCFKFNPKTTAFGKVNSLHMRMQCRVQKSLCTVTNRQCIILKLFILVPVIIHLVLIILKLFWE